MAALLSGDIVQLVQDRRWVSFMYRGREGRGPPLRGALPPGDRGVAPVSVLPDAASGGRVHCAPGEGLFVRRRLLSVLLGSIAVNAALGIYALVVPGFGDLQRRVLLTSVLVTAAGIVALACLPAWERRRLWPVPVVSVAASALGLVLAVVVVWSEPSEGSALIKTMGTFLVLGGAGVLSSLLGLARLARRFRWVLAVALGLIALLALFYVTAIWAELDNPPTWLVRVYGVVAILVAAFVVAVPVLHRASARRPEALAAPVSFCPGCGRPLSARLREEASCPACGARFRVEYLGGEVPSA